MPGKLIVIEGTDGAGKQTQANELYKKLKADGWPVRKISFPRYGHPMCRPVEAFLQGTLGTDVNPYGASTFYAIDRWNSYTSDEWGEAYRNGEIIVSDRYTTSNMLHQGPRLDPKECAEYTAWLKDLEFQRLGLPEPDLVIYLHADPDIKEKILESRTGKEGVQHDILESDKAYQRHCQLVALDIAKRENWQVVTCTDDTGMLPIQEIHELIMLKVQNIL